MSETIEDRIRDLAKKDYSFGKLFDRAQKQIGSRGQILKQADGKPFRALTMTDALEVCSDGEIERLIGESYVLKRITRGGAYLEW